MLEVFKRTACLLLLAGGVVAGQAHWPSRWVPGRVLPLAGMPNTFTAVAEDSYYRRATNVVRLYLPPTRAFSADANGNLLSDGERFFSYDAEDRLTNIVVSNAWRTTLAYDGLGRRRVRREFTWTNSAWRLTNEVRYLYDGGLVLQERDSNNTPRLTYTRGLDLSGTLQGAGGIGGLLGMTTPTGTTNAHYFYHADGSGNVLALVDAAGTVQARYGYEPFGRLFWQSGPLTNLNRLRFASKEMHPSSGLYDFGARWYDPFLQRWLTEDPLGEAGGLNLYRFAANDPINQVDPYGLKDLGSAAMNLRATGLYPTPLGTGLDYFLGGAAVGGAMAGGVMIGAPLAVSGLTAAGMSSTAASATVTFGLGGMGVAGGLASGYDIYNNACKRNWNGLAFDLGGLTGGALIGLGGGGRTLAGLSGEPSSVPPGEGLFGDTGLHFSFKHPDSSLAGWLGSAPTPQSGGGVLTLTGGGGGFFFQPAPASGGR
jgi:RHS repeat-associated protein